MEESPKKSVELIQTLRTPEFADFFTKEIEPVLQNVEALRNKFISLNNTAIVLSIVIAAGIYFLYKNYSGIAIAAIIIIAVLNYIKCVYALTAKSKVMSKLLSFWGSFTCETPNIKDLLWKWIAELSCDYTDTGIYKTRETKHSYYDNNDYIANPNGQYAKTLSLFPEFNRCDVFEVLQGIYKDLDLTIRSIHLKRVKFAKNYITLGKLKLGKRSVKTIFNGVLISCNVNKEFKGRVVIKKEKCWLNKFEELSLPPKVSLEEPLFESIFGVYADNESEARYLLTKAFMERLIFITKQKGKFDIICSFENGMMNIAIQKRGKWFNISLFKPAHTIKSYQKMLMDLGKILTVIDTLKVEKERDR